MVAAEWRVHAEAEANGSGSTSEKQPWAEGSLKVSQVWDSREQLDAFGERLRSILAELGINPGRPEVLEVHNIIKQ